MEGGATPEVLPGPDPTHSLRLAPGTGPRSPSRRRVAYFMAFRLGVLAICTVLAGAVTWQGAGDPSVPTPWNFWLALAAGYAGSGVFAYALRRGSEEGRLAWGVVLFDLALSTAVVQLSGGLLSGFSFLYLLTVLGAAVMGTRRLVWVAAAGGALGFLVPSALQAAGVWHPPAAPGGALPLSVAASEILRTLAALASVTALSAYLNSQLARTTLEAGSLRNLTDHILRSLTSGLVTVTPDGRITYANRAAREILGLGGLEGRRLDEIFPELAETGAEGARLDIPYRHPGGETVHVGVTTSPLRDTDDRRVGTIVHFQDVTDLHRMSEQLRRTEHLATLGRLSASVAHEVRNPLAAISGSAQLLGRFVEGEQPRRLVETIVRESSRLEKLVRDMLALGLPGPTKRVAVDLQAAVREVVEAFARDGTEVAVTVQAQPASGLPRVEADPNQLSQILWNLLRNAAEAMDGSGRVEVHLRADGPWVELSVLDEGPGFAGDAPERFLEPFASTKAGGSGFGLAIVRRIVEDHGGSVELANREAGGACVRIRLPAAEGLKT